MTGIKTTEQKASRKRVRAAREPQRNIKRPSSGKHEVDKYGFTRKEGATGVEWGLIILTAAFIHPTLLRAIPACRIYGSTERLHGNLSGQGVAGKSRFYLLMRSVPGAQCLSTSVSAQPAAQLIQRGALSINACRVTPSSVISIQDGLRGRRVSRVTHISFCPVGKITNGFEIAVPQSGSSLLCSHANPQSAHKPGGWC